MEDGNPARYLAAEMEERGGMRAGQEPELKVLGDPGGGTIWDDSRFLASLTDYMAGPLTKNLYL